MSTAENFDRFHHKDEPGLEIRIPKSLSVYTPLQKIVQGMSLAEFIDMFGWIWDPGAGDFVPWVLWEQQRILAGLLDTAKILWMPKARQMGGSELVAMKAIKVAIEENNAQVIVISKGETDAVYFLAERVKKKMMPLMKKTEGVPWPKVESFVQKTYIGEPPTDGDADVRSYIESLPSDPDAGRGRTLRLVIMDEAKTIEAPEKIFASLFPTIDKNPRGQMIILSNSGNGTWFNKRVKEMWDRCQRELGTDTGTLADGNTLFFLSTYADPTHNAEWKKRSIGTLGSELQHYTENPETMEHFFLSPEGKVIPSFEKKEGGKHVNSLVPDYSRIFFACYDHGFKHPAVLTLALYDQYENNLHVIRSKYWYEKYIDLIAIDIKEIFDEMRKKNIPLPTRYIADGSIFNKTGQASRTVAEVLRDESGIYFDKAYKYDEEGSLNLLNKRFRTARITIEPECTQLIGQCDGWVYDKNGNPKDEGNDGPDTLKYIEAELYREDRPAEAPKPKAYQRLAMARKNNGMRGVSQLSNLALADKARAWLGGI